MKTEKDLPEARTEEEKDEAQVVSCADKESSPVRKEQKSVETEKDLTEAHTEEEKDEAQVVSCADKESSPVRKEQKSVEDELQHETDEAVRDRKEETKEPKKKRSEKLFQWANFIVLIVNVAVTILNLFFTRYDKDIQYDKENNLFIERIVVKSDDDKQKSYMYSIQSSEEKENYRNITLLPMLHMYIVDKENEIKESMFINLPDYYSLLSASGEKELMCFTDFSYGDVKESAFRGLMRSHNNLYESSLYMDADIVYLFEYQYNNKRNKTVSGRAMISRRQDYLNLLEKPYLFFDDKLLDEFDNAKSIGNVYDLQCIKMYMSQPLNVLIAVNKLSENAMQAIPVNQQTDENWILSKIFDECNEYMDRLSDTYKKLCFDAQQKNDGN